MSYYFGITLKDSVLFGCDRTFNDAITNENRSDSKRYSILQDNRVFLPTGNMYFCRQVEAFLHTLFVDSLEAYFEEGNAIVSKLFSASYQKAQEDAIPRLEGNGKTGDTENVDCLYGGLDGGAPFIIALSSADDFQLQLVNTPLHYICLNQTPEISAYAQSTLKAFLGAVEGQGIDEVWELGKRFLPSLIQKISKEDPLVSSSGDLIFLSGKGIQTFEF